MVRKKEKKEEKISQCLTCVSYLAYSSSAKYIYVMTYTIFFPLTRHGMQSVSKNAQPSTTTKSNAKSLTLQTHLRPKNKLRYK